jgi:ABC-2 type transport system ATP-binding protein
VLRRELWTHFHELTRAGTTLLVSSHVMDEASLCDKLLLMRDGHIVADETPAALRVATGTDDLGASLRGTVRG